MWISYMCLTELTIIKVRSRSPPTWIQNSRKQLHLGKTVNEQYLLPGWRWEVMINHVCADSPLLAWFHGVAPFHETVIEQRNNVCYNPSYLLVPKPAGIMDINFFLLYWHVVVSKLKLSIFCERKTPRIREMVTCVGTKKKFWVPISNRTSDLPIPRSDALPLMSHRDYGERGIRRSEVRFLMGTQKFFFFPCSWQEEKHPSLFLYRAQNLPYLLF